MCHVRIEKGIEKHFSNTKSILGHLCWRNDGEMRVPENKDDLLDILEPFSSKPKSITEVNIVDGSALIHSLDPKYFKNKSSTNFQDYLHQVFLPNE